MTKSDLPPGSISILISPISQLCGTGWETLGFVSSYIHWVYYMTCLSHDRSLRQGFYGCDETL